MSDPIWSARRATWDPQWAETGTPDIMLLQGWGWAVLPLPSHESARVLRLGMARVKP